VTATVIVTVGAAAAPQILRFDASPINITSGQQSTLSWTTTGATSISISGVSGTLPVNGSTSVSPTTTTTYTLTATGANGATVSAPITVTVGNGGGATQILQFSASPEFSPTQGAPVVLTWQTTNATSVALVGGDMASSPTSLPVNGSFTVNPMDNATYTLIAYGPGGASVSAVISVYVR
jgi:hypothetical protein